MSDVQNVDVGMKRSEAGDLVEFGVVLPNGGFYSFAATRSGDYDEALAADAQTQPQQTEQPQPDSQPTETQPPAPEQPVQG